MSYLQKARERQSVVPDVIRGVRFRTYEPQPAVQERRVRKDVGALPNALDLVVDGQGPLGVRREPARRRLTSAAEVITSVKYRVLNAILGNVSLSVG